MPKLEKRVGLRLPVETVAAWKAAAEASGLSLSDWVRGQVRADGIGPLVTRKPTPQRTPRRPAVEADPALLRELARIGNNLNQIARSVHRGEAWDRAALLLALAGIERELREVLERCTSSS